MGRSLCATFWPKLGGGLGHLHDVKRFYALCALGYLHGMVLARLAFCGLAVGLHLGTA